MKKLLLTLSCMLLTISLQAQSFETATEAVTNMGVGWNLGNTLDAHGNGVQQGLESETYWGQPKATFALMKMMKEAGFGAIRVPVTWYNHMDSDGNVNAEWMARVKEVVNYVIDNGMYCILNVHHDTGDGDTHWLHASGSIYTNTKTKYEYLWKQIAEEFKDYDQHLIFEAYNEMLDKYNSWNFASSNASGGYNATDAKDAYDAINKYAQSFVTTVRNTGGNNAKRNLVINTYSAANGSGNWHDHLKDPLTEIKYPTDNAGTGHIIFQVHAYPNISEGYKSTVISMMNTLKNNLITKGPVIIGEWGTSNVDASETDYDKDRENYLAFAKYFVQQAKNKGIATFYWMGLSNGAERNLPAFSQGDLAEAIVKAYRGDSYQGKYPSVDDFETISTVTYQQEWAELFLYGDWSRTAVSLSNYKGIRVEMEDASYADKVQVKVYGDLISGENYKEQYATLATDNNVTTVTFDASKLGSTFWGVTLQTMVGPTTAKVKSAKLIKADGSEVTCTITSAWGCTVTKEVVTGILPVYSFSTKSDGAIYNLQGQRVLNPKKGIYIRNGKKYIVK